MTRQNYGTLRTGGGRRSGAWQWTVIGFVMGFGCAAIVGLLLVISGATGTLDSLLAASRPTQTPFVITATPLPATNTPPPTEVLVVPSPTVGQAAILVPTPTPLPPTPDPNLVPILPSATPTTQALPTLALAQAQTVSIPPLLQNSLSPLRRVDGATYLMGTTVDEVFQAVDECVNIWEGNCTPQYGEDSAPAHNVTVDSFQMEITEVTYDQYIRFLNSLPGQTPHRSGCDGQLCATTRAEDQNSNIIFDSENYRVNPAILNFPVVGVTWYGAKAYCEAIGRRLPTEAEWERAARGPQNFIYPWGSTFEVTRARTSRPRETDPTLIGPRPVGSYPSGASVFGMLDMAGNVAEWVSDWYGSTYYTQQSQQQALNPTGPVVGTEKVVRGGSWDAVPFFSRSVHRQSRDPLSPTAWIGFRCAAPLESSVPAAPADTSSSQLPLIATVPTTGGTNEEDTSNSQPTLPPPPVQPTQAGPLPTLNPGG